MIYQSFRQLALAAVATFALSGVAQAGITGINVSASGGAFGDNVISAACTAPINGPANTIQGCLNSDHNAQVNLTSTATITFAAGGQAKVVATSGAFDDLTVQLIGNTISELILNIETNANGQVDFLADGVFSNNDWSLTGNGNNFFDITGVGGDFTTLQFTIHDMALVNIGTHKDPNFVPGSVDDVKQIRLAPTGFVPCTEPPPICPGPQNIPEPITLSLFGAGLAATAVLRRRRRH